MVFGPGSNVIWETSLPPGKSSPIVTETRIFLTAHDEGKLLTIALDRSTGKEIWRRAAPSRRTEKMHRLNDEAAPTPVTDGTNVYAFFGGYGLVAYGADGTELWTRPLGPFTNFHGMGASPILVDGKLVQVCDQDLDAFVIAVDPADGEILWKQARPDFVHSFSTPVVHDRGQGSPEIIVPGSYRMTGYAPDGRELWRLDGLTYQVKSVPVVDGDRLYFNGWAPGGEPTVRLELPPFEEMRDRFDTNGDSELTKQEIPADWLPRGWEMHDRNKNGTMNARDWEHYRARRVSENGCMAIRLGGRGNVTKSHLIWRHQKSLPDVASPILYRGRALPGAQRRHRDGLGSGQRKGSQAGQAAGCARRLLRLARGRGRQDLHGERRRKSRRARARSGLEGAADERLERGRVRDAGDCRRVSPHSNDKPALLLRRVHRDRVD